MRYFLTDEEMQFLRDNIHPGWIDKWYPIAVLEEEQ